jgi:hypothetical protein
MMKAIAASTSIRGGSRCVAPDAGMRPSVITGRPMGALAWATRGWQASASSRLSAIAVRSIAATIGLLLASIREIARCDITVVQWGRIESREHDAAHRVVCLCDLKLLRELAETLRLGQDRVEAVSHGLVELSLAARLNSDVSEFQHHCLLQRQSAISLRIQSTTEA